LVATQAEISPLITALERYDTLSTEERTALVALPLHVREFASRQEIIREGDRPEQSGVILAGMTARTQILEQGKRQLTALNIQGDFVDLDSFLLKKIDHSVIALGPCKIAFISHEAVKELCADHIHLSRLLWLTTVVDSAIQRAWITCLGRRSAIARMAHLICELFVRLRDRGLSASSSFDFPITQADVGDILGLSVVHVNRTVQDLRRLELISWEHGRVTIVDYEGLARRGEFDPTYLNLWKEAR